MPSELADTRPVLLDLFCGAGGAAVGYDRAGFRVVGIDHVDQPNYPFEFRKLDAVNFMDTLLAYKDRWGFHAVHASPPCQGYSAMTTCRPGLADKYPRLIEPLRERLIASGLPYVIENVVGAPLIDPVMLCGTMFGSELYRHRLFETSFPCTAPPHREHTVPASKAGHWTPGTIMSVAGHVAPIAHARKIMGIDWTTREELAEAIPPDYTMHVGGWLMEELDRRAAA